MRRTSIVLALGCCAPLFVACSTASIYRAMDVVVVADDPGAVILPHAPGETPRPAVFDPFRARATWESLEPVPGVPGERAFALEAVGSGAATRGRIHMRVYEGQTRDGRSNVDRSRLVRCESDDSGAWYFDGEMVRARLPRPGISWLTWQLGWTSRFELDGRLLEGRDSRWEGGVLALRSGDPRRVRTGHWEVEFAADPGFCVQFAEEPGGDDCQVSVVGEIASVEMPGSGASADRVDRAPFAVGDELAVHAADGSTVSLRLVQRSAVGASLRIRVSRGGPGLEVPPAADSDQPAAEAITRS